MLRLSDAFKVETGKLTGEFSLELTVKVVDVKYDSGNKILEKSPSLNEYAYLISLVEKYRAEGLTRDKAIYSAIERCISDGVLVEFLQENFREVAQMLGLEYSQELEYQALMEEGIEKGKIEGKIELYFSELGYSIKQIAEKMNIGEDDVNETLSRLGLA